MKLTDHDYLMLQDDGDIIDMPDGRKLRLRIVTDDCDVMDLWTDDCYGRVEWEKRGEYPQRPDGFDGNAEKLSIGRGNDRLWWQPPADVKRSDTSAFRKLRANVTDLFEYGWQIISLEVLDGTDYYGRPIVTWADSVGGIEPFTDWHDRCEVIGDMAENIPEK